jgi:hypothetical protein
MGSSHDVCHLLMSAEQNSSLYRFKSEAEQSTITRKSTRRRFLINRTIETKLDRLCGLVVRVPGYRSGGPGSIPDATTFPEK